MKFLARPTTTSYVFENRDALQLPSFTICPQPSFHYNNIERLVNARNGTGNVTELFHNFPSITYRGTLRQLDPINMTIVDFVRRTGSPMTMTRSSCFMNRRNLSCSPTFGLVNPSEGKNQPLLNIFSFPISFLELKFDSSTVFAHFRLSALNVWIKSQDSDTHPSYLIPRCAGVKLQTMEGNTSRRLGNQSPSPARHNRSLRHFHCKRLHTSRNGSWPGSISIHQTQGFCYQQYRGPQVWTYPFHLWFIRSLWKLEVV